MRHKNTGRLCLASAALLLLVACNGGDDDDDAAAQSGEILFAPTAGVVPSPNDLAFQGSRDGTLTGASTESVNGLDGFSTTAPIIAYSSVALEPESIDGGSSVRVFEVTTRGDPNSVGSSPAGPKPVTGIARELEAGSDYAASVAPASRNNRALAITPTAPLAADTTYMVVLTDGLQAQGNGALGPSPRYRLTKRSTRLVNASGNSRIDSLNDRAARQLEGIRQLVQSQLAAAGGAGIGPDSVIGSWTFTTQSIGAVLAEAADAAGDAELSAPAFGDTGADTPGGAASIFAGVLKGLPYYLAAPDGPNDGAPLRKYWQADMAIAGERNLTGENATPRRRSSVAIPVLVTIPNNAAGEPVCSACPVAVFQHGITTNRRSALGIADALASLPAPHATVAIDLPLHGIDDPSDPLYAGGENPALQPAYAGLGDIERTFELDLIDNDGSSGPDGRIDPSGEHFINLANPRTSRDNLRQAVADLLALVKGGLRQISATLDAASQGTISLNAGDVDYIGQSLGAIVGVPFLSQAEGEINRAVLAAPGGGVVKLLDGSPTIGPRIEAGLEANGLTKGTLSYEQILGGLQTVVDTGEPLNYAQAAADKQAILVLEVVGGASSPADQVVPNNLRRPYQQGIPAGTQPSPTVGTDPLARVMGLQQIAPGSSPTAPGTDTIVRFTAGSHASLIDPTASAAVTTAMQRITSNFLATGTTAISNGSVVAQSSP